MNWCVIFVCLCFVGASYGSGNSLKDPYICGSPSCTKSEKFKYSTDVLYHYEYKVNVETYFAGSSNNRSTLDVKARVSIQFITTCEGLLQIAHVELKDQDKNFPVERSEKFVQAVTQADLRFAFHDGVISEVCPDDIEEDWVINFKRAILSLFQNTMKRFDINMKGIERDIHGTCEADYNVRGQQNTSLVVVKTRDLSQCRNRYKYTSILQTVRYDFQSKFQTWPVLKSESKCLLTIDHHIYKAVNCRERHLFEPFSGKNSGAVTTVIQDLVLTKEVQNTDIEYMESQPKTWSVINRRSQLFHVHAPEQRSTSGELKAAREVLKLLCNTKGMSDEIIPPTADDRLDSATVVALWTRLVRFARGLDHPALAQLLARAPSICPRAHKYIVDALPYIASPGSVQLIKDMIIENKVNSDTRHEWLMSMAMIPRPHNDMLRSMLELLRSDKYDKIISFTVSSMVHSYCRNSGKSLRECCEEENAGFIMEEFQDIVRDVVSKGFENASKLDLKNMLVAVKALGNMGGFQQTFGDVLMDVIGDALVPPALRLAAVDAFRRTPCTETREYFFETYRENFNDIEIRIASYLQVMRCPNLATIRQIFQVLQNEKVNQAATFVWSHLNNLGQSSLPSRVEIQGLLSGHTMPQLEDNPDYRLFSRNYEYGVFFDQYNAGGNYETNVIFSPDSYIPRSVSLNLTVDMFGESINLLELKARGEGFERYFEHFFGEKGILNKDKLSENFEKLRFTRSAEEDELRQKMDDIGYKNEAQRHQFPMAELGLKVFGNDIAFWSAEGDDEIRRTLARLNPKLRILEILSGKEISYNKASLFLDTTFSVPTGSGLPLNLNLMGTSYVNMKMSGTVVDKFMQSGNLDFEGKLHPSVAVNVAATMGVVAGALSSCGVRLNTRLYTATALAANLAVRGAGRVRLQLALPHDKQEIFAHKSELIILHGEAEQQHQGLNKNRIERNTCSWSTFDKAIGIKVCANYQFPNMTNIKNAPYFVLSGPAQYIVSLEKADPSADTYDIEYKWDKNDTANVVSFSFDTPDSHEKRMFNAVVSVTNTSSTALVSLQSAKSTMVAKAMYQNLEKDKHIEASLIVDGKKHFDTVMSLTKHDIKYGYVWIPHAYWVVNDERIAELSGMLKVKTKGGVTQWDVEAEFQTKQLASRLVGYYTVNGPTHGTKLMLDYKFVTSPKQTVKIEGLYSERALGFRHDLYGDLSMEFTAYPNYNFYAVLKNLKTQTHLDIGLNVSSSRGSGADPAFSFSFVRLERLAGLKLDTRLDIVRPRPIKMHYSFEEIGPKYSAYALINFNPKSRDIIISAHLLYPPGAQLYLDAELNMTLPTLHPCILKGRIHEKQQNEFQVNVNGVWFTGIDFNVDAMYQDQSKINLVAHRLKMLINSSHFKDIALDGRFTQDNRQITFIGQGEYNDKKYNTLVRYIVISAHNFTAYGELDAAGRVYSVSLAADLSNNTDLSMDIHFDQLRDVHISYKRLVTDTHKRLAASLNWDANRDPSQRVSVDLQLEHKAAWHHAGLITLYYPGRLVNGDFEFLLRDWFCQWHVQMGWSDKAALLWKVKMYSEAREETVYALLSSMHTPFQGWEDVGFNVMWRYHDNFQAINGSMNWQEDHLAVGLSADYLFKTNEFYGYLNAVVNSTIPTLPNAAAVASHRVVWKKTADTLLSFQYNDEGLLMINSSWILDRGARENNITGSVYLISPFQGYRRGLLNTKFVLGHRKDIHGVTHLDLEDKVLKIFVDGHMRRITNCMLVVNASSPAAGALLTARFGFVEAERHLVAMVITPNSTTGVEVLLKLTSTQDFHIFGHVALPIQYLNRAMVTAKRGPEEMDFRVGWGNMDFGFTGIWHYRSFTNFVYVYKLYTPIEGFEENGLVLKNVYGNGLDTELSVRLSTHKFGIAILLEDTDKGLLDALTEKFQGELDTDTLIENFETRAQITLDTLYYPTVRFHAHIIKFVGVDEEDILKLNATLHLPDKQAIVLTDEFILENFSVMRNTLNLVTPFQAVQELKSVYTVDITMGETFNVTCLVLVYNGTCWHEISSKMFYSYESGEDETYEAHTGSLGIATPLGVLPALDAHVSVRLEDALWKLAADIAMPSFSIVAQGRLELEDPFVETSGSLNLTSPFLEDYFIKMEFKKDFSEIENMVAGGIHVQQGNQSNYAFADVAWRPAPSQYIRAKARGCLQPALPATSAELTYSHERGVRSLAADVRAGDAAYDLKADLRDTGLSVALATTHAPLRAVKLLSEFDGDDIRGSLVTDSNEYAITGKIINREPLELSLVLVPKAKPGEEITIQMKSSWADGVYSASTHVGGPIRATAHARALLADNCTDISFKVDIPQANNKEFYFKSRVDTYPEQRRVLSVQAATPFPRLKYVKGDADFLFGPKTGYLICKYELPDMKGDGDLKWSFVVGDLFIRALGQQQLKELEKSVDLDIYFGNSTAADGLAHTDAGFRMDLDHVWQIGANVSVGFVMMKRISLVLNSILPKPNVDVHTLYLDGYFDEVKMLIAEYRTDVTDILTGVRANLLLTPESFASNSSVTWTSESSRRQIENRAHYSWDERGSRFIDYSLATPLYDQVDTFDLHGSYQQDLVHHYKIVKGTMEQPAGRQVGELDVRYGGTRHSDGHFNLTTPFARLPWLKSIFDINNLEEHSDNRVVLFWPNKTAAVNTTHKYTRQEQGFNQVGRVTISVPLNSQHLVDTQYYYVEGDRWSNGNATLDLDTERFVKTSFNQVINKSERDLDESTTDIEIENEHIPVGIKYIHEYDDSGNTDVKQATVFHLHNATGFNVTGKMDVYTYDIGKKMKLTAIHGNRTLTFDNLYEAFENHLTQGSKIKWTEDVWINYDIHITNKSTELAESQEVTMNVWYPFRTFRVVAQYGLQDAEGEAGARLYWNVRDQNNTAEVRARWQAPPLPGGNHYRLQLDLDHPSFRKDVSFLGTYMSTQSVMSNVSLELQYSDYENEYLKLNSLLIDKSNGPIRDYEFALKCTHPSTNLDLDMKSDINIHSKWYYLNNYYRFQKSLFYEKLRSNKFLVDMKSNAIHWERVNETYFYKVNGTWDLTYPDYKMLVATQRPNSNDSGIALLSMKDMSFIGHYNTTDDISYHIIGMIVDTRSAKLDAWRNFDDITTVDLASYIRLNHSRLLTSSVVWRPEIFAEVKSQVVNGLKMLYSQVNDTLMVVKEAPMEAHLAMKNIWIDAKPRIKYFLDDLNDLHVIKDDLDDFELYLNQSYEQNDFYVKDIVEFTYYVLDEMAIRNHLEGLPGMVNDMWGMMGNTSQSIKQSLTYVIETIKMAYANFLNTMNNVLEADFMELISQKLESMIMQYDNFVRDLHMKLLDYWEKTWVNATNRFAKYWKDVLKSMEPLFFKILHYTETFVFTVWRSVMDFFYNRTQELTDSPYFNYVSTFGHEMDRIYKDLMNNDLITNIKKYSEKMWNFIWNKIEKYIPFKDEFMQLHAEFKNAWETFLKTPQVVYVREKYQEAYERLRWWYEYFMVGEAMDKVWQIVYAKVTDMAKTALQYEELHRTPKTNFVFDPRKGEILLEQKLPMSWHAFNQTPDFSEIREYRAARDAVDYWLATNKSIWSYYYEVRPYLDVDNMLPPFAGLAMMTGQGTLVTFDKEVLTVDSEGTFLLCRDYRQRRFAVLMRSNARERYDLLVLRKKTLHIDLYNEQVSLDGKTPLTLPTVVDDMLVYRQTDIVTVQDKSGLTVQCNFMFKTCKIQVTGWYYASLGGLLGSYNNEQYDDLRLPNGTLTSSMTSLARGWALQAGGAALAARDHHNDTLCGKFFENKVSPLHPCFSVISAAPFLRACARGTDACALASTYLELCTQLHVPTHIPDYCVQCTTPQGDVIEEGSFHTLEPAARSTDVVFVVEAAACNHNLRKTKNLDLFVEAFDSRLQGGGLTENRYAIVGYGGRGVFRSPRALYVNNRVFTDYMGISQHFDNFNIDKSELGGRNRSWWSRSADVFAAVSYAASLPARPAAPRTLVLLPCSRCDPDTMRLDYSTIFHNLIENSATLHIVMDDEFTLSKKRAAKYLFGVDNAVAYTNKDYERLVGDAALRKQVKLPKSRLGVCTSLAMETNGTIFAGKKLQADRPTARRFSTVMGARVAAGVTCVTSRRCECRDARLHCRPCADTNSLMELPFWNSDDIDDFIDMAIDNPSLPSLS